MAPELNIAQIIAARTALNWYKFCVSLLLYVRARCRGRVVLCRRSSLRVWRESQESLFALVRVAGARVGATAARRAAARHLSGRSISAGAPSFPVHRGRPVGRILFSSISSLPLHHRVQHTTPQLGEATRMQAPSVLSAFATITASDDMVSTSVEGASNCGPLLLDGRPVGRAHQIFQSSLHHFVTRNRCLLPTTCRLPLVRGRRTFESSQQLCKFFSCLLRACWRHAPPFDLPSSLQA